MKWDAVLAKIAAEAASDPTLAGIYGATIRLAGTAQFVVPCLELSLIADSEDELWAPCTVQWDQFTKELETLRASERRLRQLLHLDVPGIFGGVGMWGQYQDGAALAWPDRDGHYGRAIRFRLTPLRERYESVQIP